MVVVGSSSAPSSWGITPPAGEGGVSEGGGPALSTVADGEVTTFLFLLLLVTTPVCDGPAAAATAAAAGGRVKVAWGVENPDAKVWGELLLLLLLPAVNLALAEGGGGW